MANKEYPNSGILYKDDKKDANNAKSRDYMGSADIICPHCKKSSSHWLSGWIKSGARGKFVSLSFKFKGQDTKPAAPNGQQSTAVNEDDF